MAKKKAASKPKKKRAEKYESKLAIKGSLDDVLKASTTNYKKTKNS